MKAGGLDKILGRLEDLDTVNLNILVQRLARERNLQETVFNTIQDGILVIDSDGIIQYANQAACPLIGLKLTDIGNSQLWKMVPDLVVPPTKIKQRKSVLSKPSSHEKSK